MDRGFAAKFTEMRHRFLRAIPLLTAILSIWALSSFATPTLDDGIDSIARVIGQQQRRGSRAPSLPPAYGHHLHLAFPRAIEKRGSIYKQEIGTSAFLCYHVFQVRISQIRKSWTTKTSFQKNSKATCCIVFCLPEVPTRQTEMDPKLTFPAIRALVAHGILARTVLVRARNADHEGPGSLFPR